jgi:polyisoprenoid-binding protein YceI
MTTANVATEKQTWAIDPTHSTIEFSVKHLMITTVKGRFSQLEGVVTTGEEQEDRFVDVTIAANSIDTGTAQRDEHLRSADFLDVANYPQLTFTSRELVGDFNVPGDEFRVVGDLTIQGVKREVVLDATFEGQGTDPWGGERMSFSASTKFDRRDFGLTWNAALETGGVMVSNEVKVTLDVQLVKQA